MTQADTVALGGRFFVDPDELYRTLRREAPVVRASTPMGMEACSTASPASPSPATPRRWADGSQR